MIYYTLAVLVGMILGIVLHKRIVREDLLLADKVKHLLGAAKAKADAALKTAKAEAEKVGAEVKDKVEGK